MKDDRQLSRRLFDAAGAYVRAGQAHEHKLKGMFGDAGARSGRDGDERWLSSARRRARRLLCPARRRKCGRRPRT